MYKYVKKEKEKEKEKKELTASSIVHDIWKSAQAPKCLIVKSLKMKIVHTVTKGKRHSAGCTWEKKIIQRRVNAWMRGIS